MLLSQQLAGLRWCFCSELCTDCPVICISEGFFFEEALHLLKEKKAASFSTPFLPLPKWSQQSENSDLVPVRKHQHCSGCWQNLASQRPAAFSFPVTNQLVGRRVTDLTILWVLVLSKHSILALTAIPAAESLSQTLETLYHHSFQPKSY